ncbi:hypothetical protein N9J84_00655 [Porticoccaceae bacterium]|nr:hypothetical protein [Porticoccaceae bacterium]
MAAIRWAVSRNDGPLKAYGPYLVMAPALVVGATFITDSNLGLFLYPALVNLVFFVFFSISLFYPPTVVEQLARWRQPDFPSEAISYTTKVTKVWCLFFVINGALSLLSLQLSEEWWLLYNGLIAYLFMGGLFAVEYLVRLRVMSRLYG